MQKPEDSCIRAWEHEKERRSRTWKEMIAAHSILPTS